MKQACNFVRALEWKASGLSGLRDYGSGCSKAVVVQYVSESSIFSCKEMGTPKTPQVPDIQSPKVRNAQNSTQL